MPDEAEKRVYVVYSVDTDVQSVAEELFEDSYRLGKETLLVRTELVAEIVALKLGILDSDNPKNGVVIKINHTYYGFFDGKLWDWLD